VPLASNKKGCTRQSPGRLKLGEVRNDRWRRPHLRSARSPTARPDTPAVNRAIAAAALSKHTRNIVPKAAEKGLALPCGRAGRARSRAIHDVRTAGHDVSRMVPQLPLSVKGVIDSFSASRQTRARWSLKTGGRADQKPMRARDDHRPIVPLGTIGSSGPYLAADFVAYSKARCQRYLLHILGANRSVARIWPLNPIVPNCCRDYRRT
jgi:hypothetical protein